MFGDPAARRIPSIVVWIPMLDGDELPAAIEASARFRDVGVPQFWDGAHALGREVARSLGAPGWTAWDIYLFYPPGAEWTDRGLPPPEAALAQAGGVVVGTPGSLPPAADQSRLPAKLRGRAIVVGEQADLDALLAKVARTYLR
jgi:hypothetical protein